jgi:hypothetical protein
MATIDLSQLPAPDVVEVLDYETLLAERKDTLISLYPSDQQETIVRTLALESEPIVRLLQENAYRKVILRQRINEAAQANMVAYANYSDLAKTLTAKDWAHYRDRRLRGEIQNAYKTTIKSLKVSIGTVNYEHAFLRAVFNELERLGEVNYPNPL